MDKYIKMLLIKLSPRYKITITTIMSYDDEKFSNLIKLRRKDRFSGEVYNSECYGKRELISELIKWLDD